jgi:hypothetical protein
MRNSDWKPTSLTKPTALTADEAAKLAKWLAPHVEAIEGLVARLKEKKLDEYDEIRFNAGWAGLYLKELLYRARKGSGIVEPHYWMK